MGGVCLISGEDVGIVRTLEIVLKVKIGAFFSSKWKVMGNWRKKCDLQNGCRCLILYTSYLTHLTVFTFLIQCITSYQ